MTGSIETSASFAVIFVHGFLDAGAIWDDVIALLGGTPIKATKLDLPGMYGLSEEPGELSLQAYAKLVSDAIRATDLPTILVGQSMGAQVVELAAADNPGRVAGLVLVTPVPLGGVNAPAEMVAPFKQLGGNVEAQRQVRMGLSPALSAEQLHLLGTFGAPVLPATVSRLVDIWNEGDPAGANPSDFSGPVVILHGSADGFVTQDMATAIGARFGDASVTEVADGGHWLHLEQPHQVADVITGMIAGLDVAGDWRKAFKEQSKEAFAEAFAEDVRLEAVTLYKPITGRDNIKHVMEQASKVYEELAFTGQSSSGDTQYLQWEARAFGGEQIFGITIITRDADKVIQNVAIHHRPLGVALKFSALLGERLQGVIDSSHFLSAADLPQPCRS